MKSCRRRLKRNAYFKLYNGTKCYLSAFNHGRLFGLRQADLSISNLQRFFIWQSLMFEHNDAKNKWECRKTSKNTGTTSENTKKKKKKKSENTEKQVRIPKSEHYSSRQNLLVDEGVLRTRLLQAGAGIRWAYWSGQWEQIMRGYSFLFFHILFKDKVCRFLGI